MAPASDYLEWFSIDEAWDTSPVTPAAVAAAFDQCGAAGFVSWVPQVGTEAVVAMRDGHAVGTGLEPRQLAATVRSVTGGDVTWGPHGAFEREMSPGGDGRDAVSFPMTGRTVYVLPTTLERLGVDRWLPSSGNRPDELRVLHTVAGGRSVLIGDETMHGGWSWARDVRPVVGLSTYPYGTTLRVWTAQGHQPGSRNRWRSAAPDLGRDWWRVWTFGSPAGTGADWSDALNQLGGERRLASTIDRVFAEIGLTPADAGRLDALSGEAWSEATVGELVSLLQLPSETARWLEEGPPPDAEVVSTGWNRLRRWARARSSHSLVD